MDSPVRSGCGFIAKKIDSLARSSCSFDKKTDSIARSSCGSISKKQIHRLDLVIALLARKHLHHYHCPIVFDYCTYPNPIESFIEQSFPMPIPCYPLVDQQ